MSSINQISMVEDAQSTIEPYIRIIKENKKLSVGLGIFGSVTIIVVFAPILLELQSPTTTDPANRLQGPSFEHLLGTDGYGRDLLSRTIHGGRISLLLGFGSVFLALLLGVPFGLLSGYYGGKVDEVIMRLVDVLISVPTLMLALLIVVALGTGLENTILAIGVVYAPRIARVVRGSTLSIKEEEFIDAAKARGESNVYILFREILPNVSSPIVVEGTSRFGFAILVGTSLSFLGLGTQPPAPDWGYMVAQGKDYIHQSPWFLLWPAISLTLLVVSLNLIGDGLNDALEETSD